MIKLGKGDKVSLELLHNQESPYFSPMEILVIAIALTDPKDEEIIFDYLQKFLAVADETPNTPTQITGPLFGYCLLHHKQQIKMSEVHEMALLATRVNLAEKVRKIL